MLDPDNEYVDGLAGAFETAFTEGGGKIVGNQTHSASVMDFSLILTDIEQKQPDLIYLPDYYQVVNLVAKQARARGIDIPFMGGDGWDSSDLDLAATNGGYFTNHYFFASTTPEVVVFNSAYSSAYFDDGGIGKTPDALAALAYDTANLLFEGIQAAGVDDTTAVKTALESLAFKGVTGNLTFDSLHNPKKSVVMLKIKSGQITYAGTINP